VRRRKGRAYLFHFPGHRDVIYRRAFVELQGQLLRAARDRVDVGTHSGRMSFDEAVDYFTEHVAFHPGACAQAKTDATARAICDQAGRAIYRYSKRPTQVVTYNLGKYENPGSARGRPRAGR
jgi:uncharacterized protein (DUF885 family)